MLKRVLEPEIQDIKEDIVISGYKEKCFSYYYDVMGCINLLSASLQNGDGLQIIDLGGGDGTFCRELKKKLPQAEIVCIEKSDALIQEYQSMMPEGIKMYHDDLLHFKKYISPQKKTLLVCNSTIHHLPKPNKLLTKIKALPISIGLFIKDFIRPDSIDDLVKKKQKIMEGIMYILRTTQSETISILDKTTRQSLYAALSKSELQKYIASIPHVQYKEYGEGIIYELTRPLQ